MGANDYEQPQKFNFFLFLIEVDNSSEQLKGIQKNSQFSLSRALAISKVSASRLIDSIN